MTERSMDRMEQAARQEWLGMLQTLSEQIQRQQQTSQQMTQEMMETYMQLFNIPLSYARKGLRDSGFPVENYDDLNAGDISKRAGGLSVEELRVIRDYEERNKNRDTVLEQLDRRIRSGS
jgi:cytochrome P450